jgi:hypothetical protein
MDYTPAVAKWVQQRDDLIRKWIKNKVYDPYQTWAKGAAFPESKVIMAVEAHTTLGWGPQRFDSAMNAFTVKRKYRRKDSKKRKQPDDPVPSPGPAKKVCIAFFFFLVYFALVQEEVTPELEKDDRGLVKLPDAVLYSFDTYAPIQLVDGAEAVMAYGYVIDDEPIQLDPVGWFPEGRGMFFFALLLAFLYWILISVFCLPENPGSKRSEKRFWVHIRIDSIVSRWGNFDLEARSCYTLNGDHINDTQYALFFCPWLL